MMTASTKEVECQQQVWEGRHASVFGKMDVACRSQKGRGREMLEFGRRRRGRWEGRKRQTRDLGPTIPKEEAKGSWRNSNLPDWWVRCYRKVMEIRDSMRRRRSWMEERRKVGCCCCCCCFWDVFTWPTNVVSGRQGDGRTPRQLSGKDVSNCLRKRVCRRMESWLKKSVRSQACLSSQWGCEEKPLWFPEKESIGMRK